jgi:hypothetical protein
MEEYKSFLGRYEAQTKSGMSAYLEIIRLPEGGYEYSYGIGSFMPKERVKIATDEEILEKVGNAMASGYHKVKDIAELKEDRTAEETAKGFDFMSWMAGGN